MEKSLIYIGAIKRYIKSVTKQDVKEVSKYKVDDEEDSSDGCMVCLVDVGVDVNELDINDMNINKFTALSSQGVDVSYAVRCIIPNKYMEKGELGYAIDLSTLSNGYVRIEKNVLTKDQLTFLLDINRRYTLGI